MTGLVALRALALGWAGLAAAEAVAADDWAYYFGVFVIVLAQCAGVPLPAVAVLLGAYASARHGDLNLAAVIAVGSLGAMLGSTIGYILGRVGGRPLMLKLAKRFHADEKRIIQMESFFERHGGTALFFGRWVIVVRLWGAIAAGAAKMAWPKFALWTIFGSIAWVASLSVLAYLAGALAHALGDALDIGGWVLVPIVLLGLLIVWRRRRRRKLKPADTSGNGAPDAEGTSGAE
jgi:undecaprenyl-diphosphatase